MPVGIRSFITVEEALTRALLRTWRELTADFRAKLYAAIKAKDWQSAHRLSAELSPEHLWPPFEAAYRRAGLFALLYGASQVREGYQAVLPEDEGDRYRTLYKVTQSMVWARSVFDNYLLPSVQAAVSRLILVLSSLDPTVTMQGPSNQTLVEYEPVLRRMLPVGTIVQLTVAKALNQDLLEALQERMGEDDFDLSLDAAFEAALDGTSEASLAMASNLYASRMSALGFLSESVAHAYLTYQISAVLDDLTCRFCAGMHGRTFKVDLALNEMQQQLDMGPDELAAVSPFPKQDRTSIEFYAELSNRDLQGLGFGQPPYHPRCRCMLVRRGTIPRDERGEFEW